MVRLNIGPLPPRSNHTDEFFYNDKSECYSDSGQHNQNYHPIHQHRRQMTGNHQGSKDEDRSDSDGGLLSAASSISSESSLFTIDSNIHDREEWKAWGNECVGKANLIAAYLTHTYHQSREQRRKASHNISHI